MAGTAATLPPRFDALDPRVLDDPYPAYRELRAAGPLARAGPGTFAVTRHADVNALLRDRRLGSEFPDEYHLISSGEGAAGAFFHRIVLYRDPPAHTRLRQLIGKALTPRLVRALEPEIAALVEGLLDTAAGRGEMDAVGDLAFPLPVLVICRLLGVPASDRELIRPHALGLSKAFAPVVPEAERAAANAAVAWLQDYLSALLEEKRRRPADDLLSSMLVAEDGDDRLTHEEIVDNAVFSFFAGFETTVNLLATGCALLLSHPDELARLRADPSLVSRAVEEFLRYDAPIQGVARLVREPVEIGGRTIRDGRVLVLLIGSANHDEAVFADPERLDVGRDPNPQLAFGAGPHFCLGAPLARLEGTLVFSRLLERFPVFEPAGEAVRRRNTTFRSYESVPVRLG